MRKYLFLFVLGLLFILPIYAERVDVSTARKVAEAMMLKTNSGLRSAKGVVSLVYYAPSGQKGSSLRNAASAMKKIDYFVFNVSGDKGFVIVSGDDRVRPILAYSNTGKFDPDNLPDNLKTWLAGYQDQITWAENKQIKATPNVISAWSQYLNGAPLKSEGKSVLLKTALWEQHEPYNRYTPKIDGKHAVTGCVATAMGIVMKYFGYPDRAVNPPASNSYTLNDENETITVQIDYSDGYDWDLMLTEYEEGSYTEKQANEVAKLLYHCGANLHMDYSLNGSSTPTKHIAYALSEVFGYSPSVRYLLKEAYRWEEWKEMIRKELDEGYPVILHGENPKATESSHAFVCDGYQYDDLYHINWGWGGSSNGYYTLSLLNNTGSEYGGYNSEVGLVLNIRPMADGQQSLDPPYLKDADFQKNGNTVNVNCYVRYSGIINYKSYVTLGIVDKNGTIYPGSQSDRQELNWESNPEQKTKGYKFSLSLDLTSSMNSHQYVAVLHSFDGTDWTVMRVLADGSVPLGINQDGQEIYPTKDIPNDPVTPMHIDLSWNSFDDAYMRLLGLDNSQDAYYNTQGICYHLTWWEPEDVIYRYTIHDYSEWKNHIAIYSGNDGADKMSLSKPEEGSIIPISDDGVFEVKVKAKDLTNQSDHVYYYKVLTDKAGELSYDIAVYTGEKQIPVFESMNHKMIIIKPINITIDEPVRGAVNQEIPFNLSFSNISSALLGGELSLNIWIYHGIDLTLDQIQLYNPDGQQASLKGAESERDPIRTSSNLKIGKLEENKLYTLKIVSSIEISGLEALQMHITPYVNGQVVSDAINSRIIVDASPVKMYKVTVDLPDWLSANSPTQAALGESFNFSLICQNGYQLPKSIVVTMGGKTLVPKIDYEYDESGMIFIYKVTGDVVIKVDDSIPPTAIEDIESVKVYTRDRGVYIETPLQPTDVIIITMNGSVVKREQQVGTKWYELSRGIYIIYVGNHSYKVRI